MTVPLAAVEYGAGPPLAILHGLFGSGRNWATIAQRLAAQQARREGNGEYATRLRREAHAHREAEKQAKAREEAEFEM